MTQNEASLVGTIGSAVIAALVAAFVARYVVKKSPDYQKQLDELRSAIGRVADAHEGSLAHQKQRTEDEQKRLEAQAWHPARVFITNNLEGRKNTLNIRADRHFTVDQVEIMTTSGAVVATFSPLTEADVKAMGQEIDIPNEHILALVNPDPDYQHYQKTTGRLRYTLDVGVISQSMTFELPFRAMQWFTNNTVWPRLEG